MVKDRTYYDNRFSYDEHLNSNVICRLSEKSKKEAEQHAAREALKLMGY